MPPRPLPCVLPRHLWWCLISAGGIHQRKHLRGITVTNNKLLLLRHHLRRRHRRHQNSLNCHLTQITPKWGQACGQNLKLVLFVDKADATYFWNINFQTFWSQSNYECQMMPITSPNPKPNPDIRRLFGGHPVGFWALFAFCKPAYCTYWKNIELPDLKANRIR